MNRKRIINKLTSYALTISLLMLASGCNKKGNYIVIYNNDSAIIYDANESTHDYYNTANNKINQENNSNKINQCIIFSNVTLEEVKEKIYSMIGEDAYIRTYGFEEEKELIKKK